MIPAEHLKKKVHEHGQVGEGWRWPLFDVYLPMSTLFKMAVVIVCDKDEKDDTLTWGEEPDGECTVS